MQTSTKAERLSGEKLMEKLFEKGKSFRVQFLQVKWLVRQGFDGAQPNAHHKLLNDKNTASPIRVVISVPKRKVKKAVDRNRIKRQVREAYRKNKSPTYEALEKLNKRLLLMIIYTGENKASYQEIESKIILLLQRLVKENENSGG